MADAGQPFDEQERTDIRFYLGYQDMFHQIHTSLESQLTPYGVSQPAVERVRSILADLASIDDALVTARKRLKARKAGEITLNAEELEQLRGEGRRLVARLGSIFGVRPKEDVFGEGAGANGGLVPLG